MAPRPASGLERRGASPMRMQFLLVMGLLAAPAHAGEPKEDLRLQSQSGPIQQFDFSNDGQRLVTSTSTDESFGVIQLWDVATGKEVLSFKPEARGIDFALAPDGKRLVYWSRTTE